MVVATNARPGRTYRALVMAQNAKGTAINDFTSATQLWTHSVTADVINDQIDPEWWMNYHNGDFQNSRYPVNVIREGIIEGHASPAILSILLQSLFGTYNAPNFTLTGYVNKWLSIACVEDKTLTNTNLRVARLKDAMIYRLTLTVDSTGYVTVRASYAAEDSDTRPLNNLAGIVLPAAPMDTLDQNVFPGRSVTLTRDPSGTNTQIPFERLELEFDINLDTYWDQMGRRTRAIRRGPLSTSLVATGKVGDEYWQSMLDSNTNTKKTYLVSFTEPVSGHALSITFTGVTFDTDPFGVRNQTYEPVSLMGMATQDLSGNFLSLSLT